MLDEESVYLLKTKNSVREDYYSLVFKNLKKMETSGFKNTI